VDPGRSISAVSNRTEQWPGFEVPHPDHILGTTGGMVAVADDARLVDVVAALHITSIRSLRAASA
jgi:hypothetical protein